MVKNIYCTTALLIILVAGGLRASNFGLTDLGQAVTPVESFNEFFQRFNKDKAFQYSRITFPLKNIYDDENGRYTTKYTAKKNHKYADLSKIKHVIITRKQVSKGRVVVKIQIGDAGIYVEYDFMLRANKWYLERTVDRST
ncbi:DUF4348 domain-containing protein [Mucilaginibacter daejeonensis]|uniref:DUF4348 domain-containing protein n=1 Tax=Mucilaginibacter daejeonensis TaxID=398049 RepID=UPI001D176125|nr:DUF4348 domain-containing protein [Mucilaginibacter daejeonensis]UEG51811.1 DUF4348 domain-containing protein [Mucilaginibacter daejeonensis]